MSDIQTFNRRLEKIGIKAEYVGNFPWIYLDKVNGKKVQGRYLAEHGFTAFWYTKSGNRTTEITDIAEVFKKIRETLSN